MTNKIHTKAIHHIITWVAVKYSKFLVHFKILNTTITWISVFSLQSDIFPLSHFMPETICMLSTWFCNYTGKSTTNKAILCNNWSLCPSIYSMLAKQLSKLCKHCTSNCQDVHPSTCPSSMCRYSIKWPKRSSCMFSICTKINDPEWPLCTLLHYTCMFWKPTYEHQWRQTHTISRKKCNQGLWGYPWCSLEQALLNKSGMDKKGSFQCFWSLCHRYLQVISSPSLAFHWHRNRWPWKAFYVKLLHTWTLCEKRHYFHICTTKEHHQYSVFCWHKLLTLWFY